MMCVKFHGLHDEMAAPPCLSCPGTITAAAVPEAEYCKFIIQTPIKDCGLRWGRAGQDRYENPIKAALKRSNRWLWGWGLTLSRLLLQHVCRENCKLTALLTQLEQKIQRKRVNKINTKSSSDSTRTWAAGQASSAWSALSIFPAFSSVALSI